jgi:hypothetical protein
LSDESFHMVSSSATPRHDPLHICLAPEPADGAQEVS